MKRTPYQPAGFFEPAGKTYSHGVIVESGRTLYVAGQTARDAQGKIVGKGDAAGLAADQVECVYLVIDDQDMQSLKADRFRLRLSGYGRVTQSLRL